MTSRQKFFIILSTNENKSVGNVICLRNSVQEMSINNNDFLPLQLLLFETLQFLNFFSVRKSKLCQPSSEEIDKNYQFDQKPFAYIFVDA